MDKDFVANKLMNVIRDQLPNVNLPSLRQRSLQYFPYVESYLKKNGIPEDFKYLPIVESNFQILTSRAGARGVWQLMPGTAIAQGLIVNDKTDERDDISKATMAASKVLTSYYNLLQKKYKVWSWVLTAAAYNFGIGNIFKAMENQGNDYFSMNLNPETAQYVYKIVAIKELFEFPELYMKSFGYNVFAADATKKIKPGKSGNQEVFNTMSVNVSKKKNDKVKKTTKEVFVAAHIKNKYRDFSDGDLIAFELDDDLAVEGGFTRKGSVIKGTGWIIDKKVYVDLGYGHDVLLYDSNGQKGIDLTQLRQGEPVLLKNEIPDDQAKWK